MKIKDIDMVQVGYSSYLNSFTPFSNISDTCTWRLRAGGAKGTDDYEKYANLYKAQPFSIPTCL